MEELRNKIRHYKDIIETNQIKTQIKDVLSQASTPLTEIKDLNLSVKKTLNNKEFIEPLPKNKKSTKNEVNTPINCAAFNLSENHQS